MKDTTSKKKLRRTGAATWPTKHRWLIASVLGITVRNKSYGTGDISILTTRVEPLARATLYLTGKMTLCEMLDADVACHCIAGSYRRNQNSTEA